jgi:putative MATE family efflux protein
MDAGEIEAGIEAEAAALTQRRAPRDLTQGNVAKTLLLFALPSLGSNMLQSLNQTISSIYLGKLLGENALAATTVAGMIWFLVFSTIFGLAMASTILIGQAMGRRDIGEVRRTVGSATGLFIIFGIFISVVGYVLAPQTLALLDTPKAAFGDAVIYLRMTFVGMPIIFISVLLQSALRGVGDAMTPLYATIMNVALCVLLNPLFIAGFGPFPPMGIAGAATAGIVANLACLIFIIARIYEHDMPLRLRGREWALLKPDLAHLRPILIIGLPMGLSMIIMSASQLVMMGLINHEGVETVAAFGAANQLWSYVQMPAFAVSAAVSAMAAQNIGAGKWDRIDKIMWAGVATNIGMTAVIVAILTLFSVPFLGLFLPHESAAIPIGVHIQWIVGWSFILMGITMVVTSIVRANGAVVAPLLILIFGSVIVRFAVGFIGHPSYGADAIWWSYSASSIASACLAVLYYKSGHWRKKRVFGADAAVT